MEKLLECKSGRRNLCTEQCLAVWGNFDESSPKILQYSMHSIWKVESGILESGLGDFGRDEISDPESESSLNKIYWFLMLTAG